jgi:hypothetical protein
MVCVYVEERSRDRERESVCGVYVSACGRHTEKKRQINTLLQDIERSRTTTYCHILEAVHPLLALTSLSTHIDHAELNIVHLEIGFNDTCGFDARPQQIQL